MPEEAATKFVYNSHIQAELTFDVVEIDKFAQNGIDCFRGFAQFYTRGFVPKVPETEEEKARVKKAGAKVEMVMDDILLCEMLISLPKVFQSHADSIRL
jgi:hypothetical protein